MTHEEIAQLSIFEIAITGWRLTLQYPISALLGILPFLYLFWFAYKYLEQNSIRDLLSDKSKVYEARKKLGIKEK